MFLQFLSFGELSMGSPRIIPIWSSVVLCMHFLHLLKPFVPFACGSASAAIVAQGAIAHCRWHGHPFVSSPIDLSTFEGIVGVSRAEFRICRQCCRDTSCIGIIGKRFRAWTAGRFVPTTYHKAVAQPGFLPKASPLGSRN